MELGFSEVASSANGKDGQQDVDRVGVEFVTLMVVVILEVYFALEGDSSVGLHRVRLTSTIVKVSSQKLTFW